MADENYIHINVDHIKNLLNEREQKLFMALLKVMDGKRDIEEFAPSEWQAPEKFELGMCSACHAQPMQSTTEGVSSIKCSICHREVKGDERAKNELWQEWVRFNTAPETPAGPHVKACDALEE